MSDDPNIKPEDHRPRQSDHLDGIDRAALGDDSIHSIHQQLQREKEEPTEGFSQIPIFLLFLFGALVFWGGIYIANHSGEFRSDIFNPDWQPGLGGDQTAAAFDPLKKGERLFKNNCTACHQAEGQGVPGVFPPLANSPYVIGSEDLFVKILLRGMSGPIEVLGNEYNGNMPSYGENGLGWSDQDIHAITTYVRQAFGNTADPITEETVARVRSEIADKSNAWSASELLAAHPLE